MPKPQRRTFQEILRAESPRIARALETKARTAAWLAKTNPHTAQRLYSLKSQAVRQLFRIPGQMPLVRNAWKTQQGFLLSIRLRRTHSSLHFPYQELSILAQRLYAKWVADRARGKRWYSSSRIVKGPRLLAAPIRYGGHE
jgi:hypothetical protein